MSLKLSSSTLSYIIIIFIGAFVFIPFIGNVHLFDWDEANFAEAAREMLLTKNWMQVQINFEPFWEKPPVYIWLQALSMSVFGVNEFAARLPNAVTGIVTLCVLFYIGKRVSNERFAWIWVLVYAGSWLPHFYFKSGIMDPVFNLFIFLTCYQLYNTVVFKKMRYPIWAGFFLGAAVLTKGPAAILIIGLCILFYWIVFKAWKQIQIKYILVLGVTTLFTIALWFGVDIIQNGWWFTHTFIEYQIRLFSTQDAGHGGPFYYHFVVLLLGCFPASVFLFQYTWNRNKRNLEFEFYNKEFGKWMQLLFWINLILFSIVKTKIVHYSSLCYFPLGYLAAREIELIISGQKKIKIVTQSLLFVIGGLLALIFIVLPIAGIHIDSISTLIEDEFTKGNLQAAVQWTYYEVFYGLLFLIGLLLFAYLLYKRKSGALIFLFLFQIIIIELIIAHFTPKVEPYSQGAAISFYKSIDKDSQLVFPAGFKSYAYLFYSDKQPPAQDSPVSNLENAKQGLLDKETFVVIRSMDVKRQLPSLPPLIFIKEENGFYFYKFPPSAID